MGFVAVKCPSCGASVELDSSREFGFCTYCGTKVMQEKVVVEHRGNVRIDGTITAESLLERGNLMLRDGDFANADMYFNRVLDIDPHCAEAYWGRELCYIHVAREDLLLSYGRSIKNDSFYLKAVEFSDGEQQLRYIEFGNKTENNQNKDEIAKQIEEYKTARKRVIRCYSIIVVICFVLALMVCFLDEENDINAILKIFISIFAAPFAASIPSAIATPFQIKNFKTMRKLKLVYLQNTEKKSRNVK